MDLQQAISYSSHLIRIDPQSDRLTTPLALSYELDAVHIMRRGTGTVEPILSPEELQVALSHQDLTDEQRQAVEQSITTANQVIAWQGCASSRKTDSLSLYCELAESQGYRAKGYAVSVEAAKSLEEWLQIPTTTVAGLLPYKAAPSELRLT
jgi:hypothetical protein